MKKVLSFCVLLGIAAVFAIAAPEKRVSSPDQFRDGYSLSSIGGHAGLWVQPNGSDGPYGALYSQRQGNYAVLGFSRSAKAEDAKLGRIHDLAFIADAAGVRIQVVDENGDVHSIPATALLKLEEKKPVPTRYDFTPAAADKPAAKSSDTPVVPKAAADPDAIPAGHKFLYAVARTKAITEYARTKGVSRAAAREKVDSLDDATLHAAVQASGAFTTIKAQPSGGRLSDFLDWLLAHQEQIAALVKLILSLLAFI